MLLLSLRPSRVYYGQYSVASLQPSLLALTSSSRLPMDPYPPPIDLEGILRFKGPLTCLDSRLSRVIIEKG